MCHRRGSPSMLVEAKFSPHALVFQVKPVLTLSYQHCIRPNWIAERVAYVDESENILEYPQSRDRTTLGLVDAWLDHFSGYTIAF